MSYFMQNGDAFVPTAGKESVFDTLPVGNYIIAKSMSGLYFNRVPMFDPVGKVYGDVHARAERVLNTFEDRPRTTGVLYAGEKGSGKSMEARIISEKGYARGYPTIIINAPWSGDEFNALLSTVETPAIIFMDEFEKVYREPEHQEAVLSLLDGVMTTKKLFLLTVNNKWQVSSHMRNRPGRLYYHLDFDGLQPEFVREYCDDVLINSKHTDDVVKVGGLFGAFNFDVLKALVEEMNRYDEDPYEAMSLLNANPVPVSNVDIFKVQITDKVGNNIKLLGRNTHEGHPMQSVHRNGTIGEWIVKNKKDKVADEDGDVYVTVLNKDLAQLDADKGIYVFKNERGYTVTFTKQPRETMNYRGF